MTIKVYIYNDNCENNYMMIIIDRKKTELHVVALELQWNTLATGKRYSMITVASYSTLIG